MLGCSFPPLSSCLRQKAPLNGMITLLLASVLMKESNLPFEIGKTGESWLGKSPMSEMCPKLCLETCSLLCAREALPEQQTQLSQHKGRGYFGEISISKASLQVGSKQPPQAACVSCEHHCTDATLSNDLTRTQILICFLAPLYETKLLQLFTAGCAFFMAWYSVLLP